MKPASGQVSIYGVIYTAVSGVCADRIEVEPTELGGAISVTIDGESYTFQVVSDGIIEAAGAWVLAEFSVESPLVPGETIFLILNLDGVQTIYGGVLTGPVVTPDTIIDFVNEQLDAGTIGNGDANPVLNHLDQLNAALKKGKLNQAQHKLNELIERAQTTRAIRSMTHC